MPSVLYRVINYALRSSTAQNRYIYVIMSLLKSAADVVDVATTESALQQCYLDASKTVDVAASNAEAFKSNFVALVKVLSEEGLIAHVPSFNAEKKEEAKEEAKEEKKEVKEEKTQSVDPAVEKVFLGVLNTNLLGEELTAKMGEAHLPQDPRRHRRAR